MKEIKRCYLTAVISEDGKKVEQVCVNRDEYPLSPLPSKDARSILKQQRSRLETMGCNLTGTAIFDSIRQKQNLEPVLQAKKELDKVKFNAREQSKMIRWISKAKTKTEE